MLLFLLLAVLLCSVSINIADRIATNIELSYAGTSGQFTLQNSSGETVTAAQQPDADFTPKDRAIVAVCSIVQIWSIPFFFGSCIIASALLFYRNKLKKPIELLSAASEKIAANDLDFQLSYDSRDEMGRLCTSFEMMRQALLENNRELWRTLEERKRLNAAFSHDLRTPLTVLRGYSDFLKAYVPQGKISEQKLISTVSTMSGQIARLESYVQTMGEVQRLEDVAFAPESMLTTSFVEQFRDTARVLTQGSGRGLDFGSEVPELRVIADLSIINRVIENLFSNAIRYATDTVAVRCFYEYELLSVTVEDDGPGFTAEDIRQAPKPYYRNAAASDGTHFGLGLYICNDLCEKHGGQLKLQNNAKGGAFVTASFLCRQTTC